MSKLEVELGKLSVKKEYPTLCEAMDFADMTSAGFVYRDWSSEYSRYVFGLVVLDQNLLLTKGHPYRIEVLKNW